MSDEFGSPQEAAMHVRRADSRWQAAVHGFDPYPDRLRRLADAAEAERKALLFADLFLEPALLELQRRRVLGDRPDLRVVESVRRRRLDLDRDVQRHAGRRPERAEDLVGELLEVRGVAVGLQALAAEEPRLARRRGRARPGWGRPGPGPGPVPAAARQAGSAARCAFARSGRTISVASVTATVMPSVGRTSARYFSVASS